MLHRRTNGNCFFLTQLISAASADPGRFDPFEIPDTVKEMVRHSIVSLSPPAHRLLEMAAVIGVDVPRLLLEEATSNGGLDMDAGDELVERQLLVESESGDYRFSHAIVRDVVYHLLPAGRRRRLQLAVQGQFAVT